MPQPLHVLIAEDNPADAELLVNELRRAGFETAWERVDNELEYRAHLRDGLDVVLSDHEMPDFSGHRALELLKESGLEIPLLIVSGISGEETAIAAIKEGATDYLLKDRLARLGPAVSHALAESRHRRESKEAALALRASEERFRELAQNIREVFWMMDRAKTQMLYVSPAYETIWGRSCASLCENFHNWLDAIHPADRERIAEAAIAKPGRGDYDETYRIVRPDGVVRWVHDKAYPVNDADGSVLRMVGVAEDVTHYRALEEQLRRAQRIEAIGALATGVAHDLNNILAPVLMVPALLRETTKSDHERHLLDLVEQSAQRGSHVIRQLLTFSRGTGGERIAVQLRHLAKEMAGIVRETFPRDIVLCDETARDLRPVMGDPTQLHQVLMNLCVNARDAMPHGGQLTLAAKNVELTEADVQAHPLAKAGPYVAFVVADNGEEILPENLDRIYDPFFTTKPPGKGTGLGLSTVQGIVRSHDGFITLASEPGRGTTFAIFLPAAPEDADVPEAKEPPRLEGGHDETILVVDDELLICEATRLVLETQGYRVLTARHGEEAMELFRLNRESVSLVLTDVMMPVMDGVKLIRALRAIDPALKLIAISGLADKERYAELKAAGVQCILAKPCSPRELLEAVARQLVSRG